MAKNIEDLTREEMISMLTDIRDMVIACDCDGPMEPGDGIEHIIHYFENRHGIPASYEGSELQHELDGDDEEDEEEEEEEVTSEE